MIGGDIISEGNFSLQIILAVLLLKLWEMLLINEGSKRAITGLNATFSYIVAVCFIGGRNRSKCSMTYMIDW